MKYDVEYSKTAMNTIKKMDSSASKLIRTWIEKNLMNTENPRIKGKALTGDLKGLWHYRVGDYRILADIQGDKIVILILDIGHRSKIYL
ncbi:type II toxin-antitoxin system RelE/ParE family toxin [Fusobacterium sp.]|uniref:Type II toxin-antitoxin system RelE/ParE family toxin n=1 Tax=Fusobacterium nucleatum TaxID=851 RepID=A0A323U8L6_FUSNU|nr:MULTISPECIES: type II toxin-antitoxin system RelE/ParE family toxin [Fusobacterium]PCR86000.1 type II toxin-antitoxin system mRNA interferase toxin, RelE/StbE family [Fusobacterium nucleatum]PZA04038.1 type II toxin-antitoxin system RelE/ParE family toxin [Fusobacterium nucleatum]QJX49897.1 type II toxin-antitoxin system RelE/ParE family toxin [Fusobacterium nucleatum]HCE32194.1 type II toxin-antitoxin system RelE/ParE family toxin [Fusobacterium sp.]